jgi:hypothetical protein
MIDFGRRRWLIWGIVIFSSVILLAFLLNLWPDLRGGYGWRWPYVAPTWDRLLRLLPTFLLLLVYSLGIYFLRKWIGWVYLIWVFAGALAIPLALLYWWGDPLNQLFLRTISGMTTGGFAVAHQVTDWREALRMWPEMMPAWESTSSHMAVSPPGWPWLYGVVTKGFERIPRLGQAAGMMVRPLVCDNVPLMNLRNSQLASSWLGILAPVWVALTVFPFYGLARTSVGSDAAKTAVAWWPLVPSVSMFLATLNSPYPFVAVTIVWLFWAGLTNEKKWRSVVQLGLAGALTAVAILFSFAFVPLLLFAGILALIVGWKQNGETWVEAVKRPLWAGLFFGLGLLLIFGLYFIWTGHTPLTIWQSTTQYHFELDRPYWPWLWLHSWDFVIFFGLPAFCLFVLALLTPRREGGFQLSLALVLTLLIVVISGTARGETGRIWSLFMPVALVGTAVILIQLPIRFRGLFFALQAAWLVGLYAIMPTTGSGIPSPPDYANIAFPTGAGTIKPVSANFDNKLQLQAFQAEGQSAEIILDLVWEVREQMEIPYFFSVLPVGPDGQTKPPITWQPFDYQYPTTCWHLADQPLVDRIIVPLGENVVEGDWWLSLTAFALPPEEEPQYLPVQTADGNMDTQVGLGPVSVYK